MQRAKNIFRFFFRLLLFSILLLLLSAALIQFPAVQQKLTKALEGFLQEKLQTEVNIQAIRLKLPESLELNGFYISDRNQDTLISVDELVLNFKLHKLWSKQIQQACMTSSILSINKPSFIFEKQYNYIVEYSI